MSLHLAELSGKGLILDRSNVLVAEKQDLMLEQSGVYLSEGILRLCHIRQGYSLDECAESSGCFFDPQRGILHFPLSHEL
jgi:hypothetical protein